MNVYVLDNNFEVVAVIDNYISLIWTQRYSKRGDFEIMVKASKEMVSLLQVGTYLTRDRDVDTANPDIFRSVMIVQNISIETDVENGDNLIVSGYDLKDLVHRRVVKSQRIYTNIHVGLIITSLVNSNLVSTDTERVIPHFNTVNPTVGGIYTTLQVTGENVGDYIEDLMDKYGLGYEVYVNAGEMYFNLIAGTDRSMEQSTNQYVIFSESFDNLLSSNYQNDYRDYANAAYVAGEGEGRERRIKKIGSATGIDRYELWVDARDISSNEGEVSETDYNAMLEARGEENLAEHSVTTYFEGNVNDTVNYKLGVDYTLGDVVQVVTDYGISLPARITEIIESDDTEGEQMIPTFEYKGGNE